MEFRPMNPGEENEVCRLVARVFRASVAPHYSQEGIDEFLRYVEPEAMASRTRANHFVLVAEQEGKMVGMVEMRHCDHISLLFVEGDFRRQGVAGGLVRGAIETCIRSQSAVDRVTVNSSPNAVEAYKNMGFQPTGPEQTRNGIRFVPMAFGLRRDDHD